ncbi:MAG: hypothetical protein QM754_04610 [Tepidisphaeraceae bacterium]
MFHKSIAAAAAVVTVSVAVATTVSVIPASNLPVAAPTVTFDSLAASPTQTTQYTELALTLSVPSPGYFYRFGNNLTVPHTAVTSTLFSFSQPVNQVAWTEFYNGANTVTLYSDAAGTLALGTFSTTHTASPSGATFAFESDTPFGSFTINSGQYGTMLIDDLRYANAVPEPSVLIAGLGAVSAYYGLQRRRRA